MVQGFFGCVGMALSHIYAITSNPRYGLSTSGINMPSDV